MVGVTRRTLQEYNRIGLLKPTAKTEGGYWLYDELAVNKLKTIQVFVEIGYKRNKVKQLLESQNTNIIDELDQAEKVLEEKIRHLIGTINVIKSLRARLLVPPYTSAILDTMLDKLIPEDAKNEAFVALIKKAKTDSADIPITSVNEMELYLPIIYSLMAIGKQKEKQLDDIGVQKLIDEMQELISTTAHRSHNVIMDNGPGREGLRFATFEENMNMIKQEIREWMTEEDMMSWIESISGNGAGSFIRQAINGIIREEENDK